MSMVKTMMESKHNFKLTIIYRKLTLVKNDL